MQAVLLINDASLIRELPHEWIYFKVNSDFVGHVIEEYNHNRPLGFFQEFHRDYRGNTLNYIRSQVHVIGARADQRVSPTTKFIVKKADNRDNGGKRERRAIMLLTRGAGNIHVNRVSAIIRRLPSSGYYFIWRYAGTSMNFLSRGEYPGTGSREQWLSQPDVVHNFYESLRQAVNYQYQKGVINLDYKSRNVLYHPTEKRFVFIDVSKVFFLNDENEREVVLDFGVFDNDVARINRNTKLAVARYFALVQMKSSLPNQMRARWQKIIDVFEPQARRAYYNT